jgi:hypothetical protein
MLLAHYMYDEIHLSLFVKKLSSCPRAAQLGVTRYVANQSPALEVAPVPT